jgi:predicted metalloprotease with PDZ domain
MKGELLWVYEGLTTYLGQVLAARSGLLGDAGFQELLALQAEEMRSHGGRSWRTLGDTATAASTLYGARSDGAAWRRGVDFYPEGALLWLEADVLIRQKTSGARSLDDFLRAFLGGRGGAPSLLPYGLDDVLAGLGAVAPLDWRAFFAERVDRLRPAPPVAGLQAGGWMLDHADEASATERANDLLLGQIGLTASLGLRLDKEFVVVDVVPGSPAARAGVPAGAKVLGVNGRALTKETRERLSDALAGSARGVPVELLLQDADFFITAKLDYQGGPRYPTLKRDPGKPDLLSAIAEPRVPPAAAPAKP